MKRHARSLALRETQIAAAAIRYYLFIRVAKVETATPPSKCWRGCGETGSLTLQMSFNRQLVTLSIAWCNHSVTERTNYQYT